MTWAEDSKWESDWWGNCANTLREELLQFSYARLMGLETFDDGRSPYNIAMHGKSVLDIGGGPASLLLKCKNLGQGSLVVDPCIYPTWTRGRYQSADIGYACMLAEDLLTYRSSGPEKFDEVWIYNVFQHVIDPEKIAKNALALGKTIRIYEWIDAGISKGHPHELTQEKLDRWFNTKGSIGFLHEHGAVGKYYVGAFNVGN